MKKWICTVCGYEHIGDRPPDFCPVCGVPASKFELVEDKIQGQEDQKVQADKAQEQRWECSVCGYIHLGSAPPEVCPVCGVDASHFKEIPFSKEESHKALKKLGPNGMKLWQCTVCLYIYEGDEPPVVCPRCWADQDLMVDMSDPKPIPDPNKPDTTDEKEADVLVVGTGAASFAAAIKAKTEGKSVIMLEKSGIIGGTTRRSGGGFWVPKNRHQVLHGIHDSEEDAIHYMARQSYPDRYNPDLNNMGLSENEYDLIETYARTVNDVVNFLEAEGVFETMADINSFGRLQVDYQDRLAENKQMRGRILFPKRGQGVPGFGVFLIECFKKYAKAHDIPVNTHHEVVSILRNEIGDVYGLEVKVGDGYEIFRAGQGIIFGSGGYTHNKELMRNFQRGPIYGGCASPECTGDFIPMAAEVGAKIGNMAGAFRAQCIFEAKIDYPYAANNCFFIAGDSVFQVNKYGKRVHNEKRNYNDRGMAHFRWDSNKAEWTNQFLFLIFDDRTLDNWQGFPPYAKDNQDQAYIIQGRDIAELTLNIQKRLEERKDHIGSFSLDPSFADGLKETLKRFNEFARSGKDLDFGRGDSAYEREWGSTMPTNPNMKWPEDPEANYTLYPLNEEGPFYAVILGSSTLDTCGGPVINKHGQVLDWEDFPIRGLYGAGNCIASPSANAYWGGGGTIGPALAYGYLAAKHIADQSK